MNRRPQRGFTLIELMVALVVSSLLVGMILAIFSRMSLAYRGQQQIAGVQQVLAAARATIELDAKQAGLQMPQGFRLSKEPTVAQSPLQIVNGAAGAGPDRIAFFYADPTTQAKVTTAVGSWPATPTVLVDSSTGFAAGDVVVMATPSTALSGSGGGADIMTYNTCVVEIQSVATSPASLTFTTSGAWGNASTSHCQLATVQTMVYKFVGRGYRIDRSTPARAELGPLQQSPTGGLLDDWVDLAYGFTDLQTAVRMYEDGEPNDLDGDLDATRDWYSDAQQDSKTVPGPVPPVAATPVPIQLSISLVARTDREVEGIATAATPQLIDIARPGNNSLGDNPSVALPSAVDDALKGQKIYRYTTFQVDLRNLGVGR
jgi:prepilin-type N-terminal cleavage/methylation domain-containing protein